MKLCSGRGAERRGQLWLRVVARGAGGCAALALLVFHLRLLWRRLDDQSVFEPLVAAKWLAAGLLLLALWRLKARGYRLLAGRRAGVIWLLALVLHLQLPVAPAADLAPALPAGLDSVGWLWAVPAVSIGAGLTLLFGLALAAALGLAPPPPPSPGAILTRRLGAPVVGALPALSTRPPPLLS